MLDDQIKVGLYVEYVENVAGNLNRHSSYIKSIDGDNVSLENGHNMDICGVQLYLLHK